jgi:ABC-type transport system involved in cytochrome bd biosynthesis fused ATPase/permease subunit
LVAQFALVFNLCGIGVSVISTAYPVWRHSKLRLSEVINQNGHRGVESMDNMKLRLILMGCILTVIGVILLVLNGFSAPLVGILVIGIILAVVGIVWTPRKKADSIRRDT